jgi:drug/metabolite transporter (DMT)-like permease
MHGGDKRGLGLGRTETQSAWRTHGALLLVQVAFATQAVEGKLAMVPRALGGGGVDPWALSLTRMVGGAVFFQLFAWLSGWRTPTSARDKWQLLGLSLLGIVLNQTLFLMGLRTTTSVSAALLSVLIPVFTAVLSVAFRVEKSSARLWIGLAISVAGVLHLTGVRSVDHGAVLVVINSLCYSAYLVLARNLVRRLGAFTVVTWAFTFGALVFAPFAAPSLLHDLPGWNERSWALVGWVLAMPTIVAYIANAWALGRATPSLVTVYIFMQPPLAALLAWAQLGQPVTSTLVVAGVLIIAGVSPRG